MINQGQTEIPKNAKKCFSFLFLEQTEIQHKINICDLHLFLFVTNPNDGIIIMEICQEKYKKYNQGRSVLVQAFIQWTVNL